jgi:hypothetical protein
MTEETRIIKTLISEIRFELEKILPLKDDMLLLKASFGDIAPDKFKCSAAGYLLHNFYNGENGGRCVPMFQCLQNR